MGKGNLFVLSIFSVKISRPGIFNQMQKKEFSNSLGKEFGGRGHCPLSLKSR
jgi:hypothetical protein